MLVCVCCQAGGCFPATSSQKGEEERSRQIHSDKSLQESDGSRDSERGRRLCDRTVEEVRKQYYRSAAWLLACRSVSSMCFLLLVLFTPLVKMSSASVSREIKATLSFLPQGHLWRDLCLAFREIAAHRGRLRRAACSHSRRVVVYLCVFVCVVLLHQP